MFNILLVDDEIKITQVVKAYLDKEGYNTFVAHDGKKALELFNQETFDLVILDRMLPDISGEEICEKIRQTSLVHIIMLTAKTEEEDKIDGFNLGCDDYVCKPFNVKELILRIKAVFRKIDKGDVIKIKDENECYRTFKEAGNYYGKFIYVKKNNKAKAVRFTTLNEICKVLNWQPGDILEYVEDKSTYW